MLGVRTRIAACVVGIGMLAACGGSGSSISSPGSGAASPSASPAANVGPVTVSLNHVPNGTAILTYDASTTTLTVEIKLIGLAPSSTHPAHIHAGSCAKQGHAVYPLNAVTADAKGVADTTTKVANLAEGGIPTSGWYVNVHNGPGAAPDVQNQPISCGDVVNSSAAASVTVQLTTGGTPPPGSADESASGTAKLSIVNGSLQVTVSVTGLVPGGTHALHIHAGSCASQGAVVYPLTGLTADASGAATSTTTVSNVSSIPLGAWYVNVHRSTVLTEQYDFDPIVCGDVT